MLRKHWLTFVLMATLLVLPVTVARFAPLLEMYRGYPEQSHAAMKMLCAQVETDYEMHNCRFQEVERHTLTIVVFDVSATDSTGKTEGGAVEVWLDENESIVRVQGR